MKKYVVLGGALALSPLVALAATGQGAGQGLAGVLGTLGNLIKIAVPIVISFAVLAFLWGLAMYLWREEKEQGKDMMIWGIVGLFVMVSIWGLVNLLKDTFGLDTTNVNINNPVESIIGGSGSDSKGVLNE